MRHEGEISTADAAKAGLTAPGSERGSEDLIVDFAGYDQSWAAASVMA
jgi:hypothetical protein